MYINTNIVTIHTYIHTCPDIPIVEQWQRVAVCEIVWLCAAVRGGEEQRVALCFSVLQCVHLRNGRRHFHC